MANEQRHVYIIHRVNVVFITRGKDIIENMSCLGLIGILGYDITESCIIFAYQQEKEDPLCMKLPRIYLDKMLKQRLYKSNHVSIGNDCETILI